MSEAPERIWASCDPFTAVWSSFYEQGPDFMTNVEYVRADLAGLPDDLVERVVEHTSKLTTPVWTLRDLLRDILTWHEQQQKGERE